MVVSLHFISLCFLMVPILSWNIDTTLPVTFSGFKHSYFGFSVALHHNSKGSFGLVSATRANSMFPVRKSLHQPGVLYKCDISSTKCEEVLLEPTANNISYVRPIQDSESGVNLMQSFVGKEDNMWLGVSLDVQSTGKGYIMTCGHLWKNQQYQKHYLANGACYMIDRDFNRNSYQLIPPLTTKELQTVGNVYLHAFALAGMSATFSEDESSLLLGAPGVYDWIGSVVGLSRINDTNFKRIVPSPPWDENPSPEAYIGYSVTTGRFFDGEVQYVAGAPRDGGNKGRVYIFHSLHDEMQKTIPVIHTVEGEKVGEYFGACVSGINVNGDNYTDLLVGSPFFSLPGGGDEGRVYVYLSNGVGLLKHRELMGSSKPWSRFGTAIANAGDLNQDGFIDVAIGAPYEDDTGAIYIYHGNSNGIGTSYAQRIASKEINPSLSGFGISISKGKDIDGNHYPDIMVGSYASDHAVLFRTRPVVKVFGSVRFEPPQIDTNSSICSWNGNLVPCFNVSFCLNYTGNHIPQHLAFSTQLTSARQKDVLQSRRYLMHQQQLFSHLSQNITIMKDELRCFPISAYVSSDPTDFISPIQMKLSFELIHGITKENTFCGSCPMLHPDLPSTVIGTVTFQTGCGEDSTCISDLKVTVKVHGLTSGELVVGQDNSITLVIELENYLEPAYLAKLFIALPSEIQIINQDSCRETQDLFLVCHAGNPLQSGQTAKFEIKLDTSHISTKLDHLVIKINATTDSQEANPLNNQVDVKIPLRVLADMTIIGQPEIEQIRLDMQPPEIETADIVHVYTVLKFLPSPITSVSVNILVPTTFINSDIHFFQLKSVGINEGNSGFAVPANCNFTGNGSQPVTAQYNNATEDPIGTAPLPSPRPKRSIKERNEQGTANHILVSSLLNNYLVINK